MIIQYSIINHDVPLEILLSLIKNLKKFCNPDIITYSDYNYKIKDSICSVLPIDTNFIFKRTYLSFKKAYNNNVDKIILINSREMYFKNPLSIINNNDFVITLLKGSKKNKYNHNSWIDHYFKENEHSKIFHNFMKLDWIYEFIFSMPSQGCAFNKEFINFFINFCEKRNIDDVEWGMDEIYIACIMIDFLLNKKFSIEDIPFINYNFDNNFIKDDELTKKYINNKINNFIFSHNLLAWPSLEIRKKYKLQHTKEPEGDIPFELTEDLINEKTNLSTGYCSIHRFSLDPNNQARKLLE